MGQCHPGTEEEEEDEERKWVGIYKIYGLTWMISPCSSPSAVKFKVHTNGTSPGFGTSISYVLLISP